MHRPGLPDSCWMLPASYLIVPGSDKCSEMLPIVISSDVAHIAIGIRSPYPSLCGVHARSTHSASTHSNRSRTTPTAPGSLRRLWAASRPSTVPDASWTPRAKGPEATGCALTLGKSCRRFSSWKGHGLAQGPPRPDKLSLLLLRNPSGVLHHTGKDTWQRRVDDAPTQC